MPPGTEKGLLLALQGTKDAPIGMMRAKVITWMMLLMAGRADRQVSRNTIERAGYRMTSGLVSQNLSIDSATLSGRTQ